MDGFQAKVARSLQFKLSLWLAMVIFGVALAAGVFSFFVAFDEANELLDAQLHQVAALVNRYQVGNLGLNLKANTPDTEPESHVILQALPAAGATTEKATPGALALPSSLVEGVQTVAVNSDAWRVFVKTLDSGSRVAVSQRTKVRDDIARNSALSTLMPFVILIPVLLLLVGNLIRQMFKPLKLLASDLDQRAEQDLRRVSDVNLPSEIQPFVVAINRLLRRVSESVSVQHRFVADAAHELRSPLTALSLQAEQLEAADMSPLAKERLGTLRAGLKRTQILLVQLLAFARAQQVPLVKPPSIPIQPVLRQVLEDLMPLAEAKRMDLGVVGEIDASVSVKETDFRTLVKNLIENAIRYSPIGGQVDVSVQSNTDEVILIVEDTGPGIPVSERQRVFDPFYRVLGHEEDGSGLGLSIVKAIADRAGATVNLETTSPQRAASGLCVRVRFAANQIKSNHDSNRPKA